MIKTATHDVDNFKVLLGSLLRKKHWYLDKYHPSSYMKNHNGVSAFHSIPVKSAMNGKTCIQETRGSISFTRCQKLIDNLPHWCDAVIKNNDTYWML